MSEPASRSRTSRLGIWCSALLLLVAVYFGAYYALVYRVPSIVSVIVPGTHYPHGPNYRTGGFMIHRYLSTTFEPAHWLDQKIRPDYWNPTFTATGWTP